MKPPTKRQQLFIEEYLQCWNGAEAARRAGYAPTNARYQARDLLAHPKIKAEIQSRVIEHAMSANEALARLAEQARTNLGDYLLIQDETDEEPRLDIARLIKDGKGHLIRTVRVQGKSVKTMELYDTQRALMLLARAFIRTFQPYPHETESAPQKTLEEWDTFAQERIIQAVKTLSMWENVGETDNATDAN